MKTFALAVVAVGVATLIALAVYSQTGVGQGLRVGLLGRGSSPVEAAAAGQAVAPAGGSAASRSIVVVGVGTATATPDLALVTVGVQTREQTAKQAQDQNNAAMAAVVAAVKGLKVADKDIQTSGVGLSPVVGQGNQVTGYQASNQVTVRVQDISQAGPVLDAAVAAGANTAGTIRFGLKDEAAANRQALDAAARDARDKAGAIAKALGVQITGVDSAVEVSGGGPSPVAVPAAAMAAPATPVQPGELSVTARVQVAYSY